VWQSVIAYYHPVGNAVGWAGIVIDGNLVIGRKDIAYHLITNTEYPGWGYSVVNGATTIWERWNSYTIEDGILDDEDGMNSFNHYANGSCTQWMYEYCLGIRPDFEAPGFKKVVFAPYLDNTEKINSAKGHYDTDYGRIEVSWERKGDTYEYKVFAPLEIECEFRFADMKILNKTCKNGMFEFCLA
jgi:alpha-L-rhamnosidase